MARTLSYGDVFNNRNGMSERALEGCRRLYAGEVAYVDGAVGQLVAGLERLGRFHNSLVVFLSDHGELFGEGGVYYEHGPTVHDANVRVPLILAGDGIPVGHVDNKTVRVIDVMPTVLRLLGIDSPAGLALDGVDVSERLSNPTPSRDTDASPIAFGEAGVAFNATEFIHLRSGLPGRLSCINHERFSLCGGPKRRLAFYDHVADPGLNQDLGWTHPDERRRLEDAHKRWPIEEARERYARTSDYKLVAYPELDGGYRHALYHLASDPNETRNVIEEHPEIASRLTDALNEWAAGILDRPSTSRTKQEMEQLERLGYIQ
jgi:arylsulfatase A-like enzyme